LAEALGIRSVNGIGAHLYALERKGLLTCERGARGAVRRRTIRITDAGHEAIGALPVWPERLTTNGGLQLQRVSFERDEASP
jgi:DNA-binding PadR family transcriptional regulator